MTNSLMQEFIEQSIYRIEKNTPRVIKCLEEMGEIEIWTSPNGNSNSVANLLLHLCGNIRQYILSALGGIEDVRERDKEFSTRAGYTKSELLNKLTSTISEATAIIKNIDETGWLKFILYREPIYQELEL